MALSLRGGALFAAAGAARSQVRQLLARALRAGAAPAATQAARPPAHAPCTPADSRTRVPRAPSAQEPARGLHPVRPRAGRPRAGVAVTSALRTPAAGATRITNARGGGPEAVDLSKLSLVEKFAFAWSVFFPPKEADHARNDAKKRLRMILVADRCALSPQSMSTMKEEIVRVVSEFVIVDQGEAVDVNMTNDEEMGTIYSVSIPVKRIKPSVRLGSLALRCTSPSAHRPRCCACKRPPPTAPRGPDTPHAPPAVPG